MRPSTLALILAALTASVSSLSPAYAAGAFYLGKWTIVRAVVAPWADPATRKLDTAERARLIGKSILFKAHAIAGPPPFACPGAHYQLTDFAPDLLFQGAFGEMHSNNKAVDPGKIAASLGFHGASTRSLETGCEFDFHFVDETTAETGLNDYVYTLKKQ